MYTYIRDPQWLKFSNLCRKQVNINVYVYRYMYILCITNIPVSVYMYMYIRICIYVYVYTRPADLAHVLKPLPQAGT